MYWITRESWRTEKHGTESEPVIDIGNTKLSQGIKMQTPPRKGNNTNSHKVNKKTTQKCHKEKKNINGVFQQLIGNHGFAFICSGDTWLYQASTNLYWHWHWRALSVPWREGRGLWWQSWFCHGQMSLLQKKRGKLKIIHCQPAVTQLMGSTEATYSYANIID